MVLLLRYKASNNWRYGPSQIRLFESGEALYDAEH